MDKVREITLKNLFRALDGIYGPNYECKHYPCHFPGQDCSFCYCPFYPCLLYDFGGDLVESNGKIVWSCKKCSWIHEKENVEEIIFVLGRYPKQRLVESDWLFFNKILQELYYGETLGMKLDNCYNLMPAILRNKQCKELKEDVELLAVKIVDFKITSVRRIRTIDEANNEVIIPLKEGNLLYGINRKGKKVVCFI